MFFRTVSFVAYFYLFVLFCKSQDDFRIVCWFLQSKKVHFCATVCVFMCINLFQNSCVFFCVDRSLLLFCAVFISGLTLSSCFLNYALSFAGVPAHAD